MSDFPFNDVAILGMGTWGVGLANVLADRGGQPRVWDRDSTGLDRLLSTRQHPKLPGALLTEKATPLATIDAESVSPDAMLVFVVPSQAIRDVCELLKLGGVGTRNETLVIAAKGLELQTNQTMPEVVTSVLGNGAQRRVVMLSGPSHAEEVVQRQPTTIVAASEDLDRARAVQQSFMTPALRVYTQGDVRGVALGGALKNIYAIGAGAAVGLGFGDNTLAALMTRGLAEMSRLGTRLGARPETFAGLTGLGDLIVTCTSRHSRNRRFGELRAKGHTTKSAMADIGMVVEGVLTCDAAFALAKKCGVAMPIVEEIHAMIHDDKPPARAIADLMGRDAKQEDTLVIG